MNEAINYLYYIFSKFNNFIFNDATIVPTVTVGWVGVAVIVFSMLISSILNLPRSIGKFSGVGSHETVSASYTDSSGYKHTVWRRYNGVR